MANRTSKPKGGPQSRATPGQSQDSGQSEVGGRERGESSQTQEGQVSWLPKGPGVILAYQQYVLNHAGRT